ncbi:unnamed protein product [Pleuronectes platessa]|uniref:Uncharacterized protein n=1 Tax=Pleuronectes platessa TaxID=8262 RepID=A0A9N7UR36_PLEPL|nr:unnamed protein product [Pleuronectes platessa]
MTSTSRRQDLSGRARNSLARWPSQRLLSKSTAASPLFIPARRDEAEFPFQEQEKIRVARILRFNRDISLDSRKSAPHAQGNTAEIADLFFSRSHGGPRRHIRFLVYCVFENARGNEPSLF